MPVADEGRGATLTLGTSTWDSTALIVSISPDSISRESLETTHLGTTNARTFIPSDLRDNGGFSIEFLHIDSVSPPMIYDPANSQTETITITYPLQASQTNAATVTGSGFCLEYTDGAAAVGEIRRGSAKFKWASTLTFTAAS